MFRNYLTIAFRHFWANKSYVLINVFGLAVGVAICMLAYFHFAYNFEFDDDLKKTTQNIYRIEKFINQDGQKSEESLITLPLLNLIVSNAPGIKQRIRYKDSRANKVTIKTGDVFFTEPVHYADSGFFQAFKYTFVKGNESAFRDKTSIVITEKVAKKYLGDKDPMGKALTLIYDNGKKKDYIIRGVIKDQPFNSTFQFSLMIRFENYIDVLEIDESDWTHRRTAEVYLEIPDPKDVEVINKQFAGYVKTFNEINKNRPIDHLSLLSFTEVGSHSDKVNNRLTSSVINPAFVVMICTIALLILLIACFNYTNTSIALASTRIKEISLRKVMGSQRKHIVWQFILEHFAISLVAVLFSFVLYNFIGTFYWNLWADEGETFRFSSYKYLGLFVVFVLFFTTLVSGAYPAFYISKLKTADALRRNLKLKGGNWFTYTLLGFQLIITVVGLGIGLVFYDNANYIEKIYRGYSMDNIIAVIMGGEKDTRIVELFKSKIMDNPDIVSISATSKHIGYGGSWEEKTQFNEKEYEASMLPTGDGYLQTMGVNLTMGRFFEKDNNGDTNCVILNEKYVKTANIANPLNESIVVFGRKFKIIGVVGDFMTNGVSWKVKPTVITLSKKNVGFLAIKTTPGKVTEVNSFMEKKWKETFPDLMYEGYPQRKSIEGEKGLFKNMRTIFLSVSVISLILSLIGLYVLITLIINKKTKEIGIRKVLGGSIQSILFILGKNFVYIFAISTLVGSLLGVTINKLIFDSIFKMDNHVDITPLPYLLCSLAIMLVAAITITHKIVKAVNANPVLSLRSE